MQHWQNIYDFGGYKPWNLLCLLVFPIVSIIFYRQYRSHRAGSEADAGYKPNGESIRQVNMLNAMAVSIGLMLVGVCLMFSMASTYAERRETYKTQTYQTITGKVYNYTTVPIRNNTLGYFFVGSNQFVWAQKNGYSLYGDDHTVNQIHNGTTLRICFNDGTADDKFIFKLDSLVTDTSASVQR